MAKRKKRTKEQTMNFMNQGYFRNVSCALSLMSTFFTFLQQITTQKTKE